MTNFNTVKKNPKQYSISIEELLNRLKKNKKQKKKTLLATSCSLVCFSSLSFHPFCLVYTSSLHFWALQWLLLVMLLCERRG